MSDRSFDGLTWRERLRLSRAIHHPAISHSWVRCPECVSVRCAHCLLHRVKRYQP